MRLRTNLLLYSFVGVLFCATVFNFGLLYLCIPGPSHFRQNIIIKSGYSTRTVSKILYKSQIIEHPKLFYTISKIYGLFGLHIKSGEYDIVPRITPIQLLKLFISGKSVIHKFTVPEGSTVHEVITRLKNEPLLNGDIEENIQEGILMPQTYFFTFGDTKQKLLSSMKKLMSHTLDELMPLLDSNSVLKTRMDVLNLASIVEKEAYLESEKPRIAAVFLNRLKKHMRLQADPTTIYGITMGKETLKRSLLKSDLRSQNHYNTYYINGLPPSPIACPSKSSIEAVLKPTQTNDIYFVVNGQGGHNFSADLKSHNNNVADYKKRSSK